MDIDIYFFNYGYCHMSGARTIGNRVYVKSVSLPQISPYFGILSDLSNFACRARTEGIE